MAATIRNHVGILEDSRTVHGRSNRHGMTPLMYASWKGHLEIGIGTDTRITDISTDIRENYGYG
ncbi:hypothetical protein V1508DRAFT_390710, partial [Lipomyces doorenjongii]|uniref:uncharacterized protein n=1 Tax=Lipomyces doorenjongii TaxID=383834 RepID=UPI0034CFF5D0